MENQLNNYCEMKSRLYLQLNRIVKRNKQVLYREDDSKFFVAKIGEYKGLSCYFTILATNTSNNVSITVYVDGKDAPTELIEIEDKIMSLENKEMIIEYINELYTNKILTNETH